MGSTRAAGWHKGTPPGAVPGERTFRTPLPAKRPEGLDNGGKRMWTMEDTKNLCLALAAGIGVVFLGMGALGAIAAALLSARITQEEEGKQDPEP